MQKLIKKTLVFLFTINIVLVANSFLVMAQTPSTGDTQSPFSKLQEIVGGANPDSSILPQYSIGNTHQGISTSDLAGEEGVVAVASPIMYAIDIFKFAVSGLAMIIIVISAVKLVSTSTEETATQTKNNLTMAIIGLIVIQIADVAVKKVFFGETGELFAERGTYLETYMTDEDGGIQFFRGIVGFINIFVGAIAVIVIVMRGFSLVFSGGDEESLTKAKKHIIYAMIGLIVIGISEVVVRGALLPVSEEGELSLTNVSNTKNIIIGLTNYISGFIAILSFVALFLSGYKYVVAGGNEEEVQKVKKAILGAVIGLALSLGAYAIVNTMLSYDATLYETVVDEDEGQSEITD